MTNMTRKDLVYWLSWFLIGNSMLFWLIGLHYVSVIQPFSGLLTHYGKFLMFLFLTVSYIGQLGLFSLVPLFILILLALLIPKPKIIAPIAILIATLVAFFLIIDSFVYSQYRFHISGIIWSMILAGASGETFDFSWLEFSLCGVIFAIILGLEIFYAWRLTKVKKFYPLKWPIIFIIGCLYLSYSLLIFSSSFSMFRQFNSNVRFLPYYLETLTTISPIKQSQIALETFGNQYLQQPPQASKPVNYPLEPLVCHAPAKPMNIVIIGIDTWRFDMLNQQETPAIYQFAKQATVYNNHFSGGNCTQPGVFTLFYGIPANYWTSMEIQDKGPVLFDELLKQNYQTGIFASAQLSLPAFNRTVFAALKDYPLETPGDNPQERDAYITQEFKTFIAKVKQQPQKPFFSFLFYDSAHTYCDVPGANKPLPAIKVCDRIGLPTANAIYYVNRYKNALMLVDQQVAQDLATLKQAGLLNNTIVIITGDHGQEFNDNHLGYWGHASNFTHYQVQTPLIIYWPGKKPGVVNYQTSHFDIAPTLLTNVLGCQNPPKDYSVGKLLSDPTVPTYMIVGSYIDFGVVEKNRITTIFPTGTYQITNLHGQLLPDAQLDLPIMRQVFKDLRRFYNNE